MITPGLRKVFDEQVELVVAELPQQVKDFMEEMPLVVDDFPSDQIMKKMRLRHPWQLLGLYTGIPLNSRQITHWNMPSDVIHIFRLGILKQAGERDGAVDEARLHKQIRRTILHEYGHHVGLTEHDLRALGYG